MTDVSTDFARDGAGRRDTARLVAVIVSLVLILAAAGAALFTVRGVDTQLADVEHTHDVRRSAQDLIFAITAAETGQRGYLLTLDANYLVPYQQSLASIDDQYGDLFDKLASTPDRQKAFEELREPLTRKQSEMEETIRLAQNGEVDQALAIVRSDAGQALMNELRDRIHTFIAQEDESLVDRNLAVEQSRQWLVAAILAALAGAATLAYALFTRTQAQVSALSRTRQTLQLQNEELEARVRERTVEAEEARQHAERERERVEALLQDTNHRIGNSLATVSSLLGLQLTRSKSVEVKAALEAAQSRVHAIASGHRRLRLGADLETANAAEFLEAVVSDLQGTHATADTVQFVTACEPITIKARDATTLGIIVSELVTNALKHAFADGQAGHIWVGFSMANTGQPMLSVGDDGRGMDDGSIGGSGGLGAMIVRQLAQQFGGEPVYTHRDGGGTVVQVALPELQPQPNDLD